MNGIERYTKDRKNELAAQDAKVDATVAALGQVIAEHDITIELMTSYGSASIWAKVGDVEAPEIAHCFD